MIFYTADLHFHYEPFLPSRPFDTVENMDRQLIHRWNEAVSEEDTVYVVGDVGYNRGLVPGDALSRYNITCGSFGSAAKGRIGENSCSNRRRARPGALT